MRIGVRRDGGFSLVEALIALGLGGAFLMSVISTWTFSTKIWKEESVRSTLRVQIESAMERVKEDTRLSDGNGILFYPTDTTPYTGISLPRATRDANGFYTMSGGQIAWDSTVIYHVYDDGSGLLEFRRTVLPTYNSNSATRQTQLDTAVTTGTVTGATSRTLFKAESITLEIVPQSPTFDAYAASVSRSSNINFGSVRLTSGTHQVRFEVTGKNAASSDYGIGIDSIALTPSGGEREVEALTVSASSGATAANELMTGYSSALWGGNYQKNFPCSAVGHYVEFDVPYDSWLVSNFDNMTHSNTEATGTNPVLSLSTRETQGLTPNWHADSQTISGTQGSDAVGAQTTVRTVINGQYIQRNANMIRVKFVASGGDLVINSAYFGVRSGREADGDGTQDFSGGATQLYFDNAPVPSGGSDPAGAVGAGTNTGITVSSGSYVWSNWFEYALTAGAACPDYLVSMNLAAGSSGETWLEGGASPTYSYRKADDGTNVVAAWLPATYTDDDRVFGAVEVAGWIGIGAATSQVYDTSVADPAYSTMTWSPTLPAGASALLKARSSDNSDMSGATAWSAIAGSSSSPYTISGIGSGRYVQFQATLIAASPYTTYPTIDNVNLQWPGDNALVEISGYYTLKPSYGQFRVLVDGEETVKGLEIKLTASDEYRGTTYSASLNAEETARNTGK